MLEKEKKRKRKRKMLNFWRIFIKIREFYYVSQPFGKIIEICRIKLWKFEKVWRNLADILNAERCKSVYNILPSQMFLFVRVFGKEKGKLTGFTKQGKKGDFAVLTRACRAACYLHLPGAVPRVTGVIFWISAVPSSAGRAACQCAPTFSRLLQA